MSHPKITRYRNRTYYIFFIEDGLDTKLYYKIASNTWFGTKGKEYVSYTDEEVVEMIEKYSLRDCIKTGRKNASPNSVD